MNRTVMVILFLFISVNMFSKETYPVEKSYTLETGMSSGFIQGISGSNGNGGNIDIDLRIVDLYENISMGITSGFNYLEGSNIINFADIGLNGGYVFHFNNLLSITPTGGLGIIVPLNRDGGVSAEFSAGVEFGFHIYERSLLTLKASIANCLYDQVGPSFTLQFGIKRSLPMYISVPPVKSRLILSPERFSPDGDGLSDVMNIKINVKNPGSVKMWKLEIMDESGQLVYKWNGLNKLPKSLIWDGYSENGDVISSATNYKVIIGTVDYLGNATISEEEFLSDILVISENNRLRINVPSIIFPPNSADMEKLTNEQKIKNDLIIGIIASKLNKYPDYSIRIEGHGNLVNWDSLDKSSKENREILVPLTAKRADAVKKLLVEEGMDESKITISGLGGEFPVVPFSDRENNWKNRRVEFILLK